MYTNLTSEFFFFHVTHAKYERIEEIYNNNHKNSLWKIIISQETNNITQYNIW